MKENQHGLKTSTRKNNLCTDRMQEEHGTSEELQGLSWHSFIPFTSSTLPTQHYGYLGTPIHVYSFCAED